MVTSIWRFCSWAGPASTRGQPRAHGHRVILSPTLVERERRFCVMLGERLKPSQGSGTSGSTCVGLPRMGDATAATVTLLAVPVGSLGIRACKASCNLAREAIARWDGADERAGEGTDAIVPGLRASVCALERGQDGAAPTTAAGSRGADDGVCPGDITAGSRGYKDDCSTRLGSSSWCTRDAVAGATGLPVPPVTCVPARSRLHLVAHSNGLGVSLGERERENVVHH